MKNSEFSLWIPKMNKLQTLGLSTLIIVGLLAVLYPGLVRSTEKVQPYTYTYPHDLEVLVSFNYSPNDEQRCLVELASRSPQDFDQLKKNIVYIVELEGGTVFTGKVIRKLTNQQKSRNFFSSYITLEVDLEDLEQVAWGQKVRKVSPVGN